MDECDGPARRKPGRPPTGGIGSRGGKTSQKAVRLPDEVITQLEQRAAADVATVSDIMYRAIVQYLEVP